MTLTADEFAVLMIAMQGESMMAIGRWQKPTESLIEKGYLQSRGGDNFNCVITPEGRAACEARDREGMDALKVAVNKPRPATETEEKKTVMFGGALATVPKRCPHCGGVLE
jgi:hypothetical protein